MERNARHNLHLAQSEKAHRTNVKLAFCATFAISLYVGSRVAWTYAESPWGLSAILLVPCAFMFVFWVINTAITKKHAKNLIDQDVLHDNIRTAETKARIEKARADGTLDKWKSP